MLSRCGFQSPESFWRIAIHAVVSVACLGHPRSYSSTLVRVYSLAGSTATNPSRQSLLIERPSGEHSTNSPRRIGRGVPCALGVTPAHRAGRRFRLQAPRIDLNRARVGYYLRKRSCFRRPVFSLSDCPCPCKSPASADFGARSSARPPLG